MPEELAYFIPSEEISSVVQNLFAAESESIHKLCPGIIIEHVGSSSIPGALTLGDLDIQLRVTSQDFPHVSESLKSMYNINHPELWTNEFALYKVDTGKPLPMSIAVTVIDSIYDEFSRLRDLFISNRALLNEYNALKLSFEGKPMRDYRHAKKQFVGPTNGHCRLLKS